jgi:hypothetical protein
VLASIIVNRYSLAEINQLADSIEELCSPNDGYGWSSSGIYCFWDFAAKEICYIGLAIDLPLRFRQHNGLSPCLEGCCKWGQIRTYFQTHRDLGYSVFAQSPMTQAITHRWEAARPGKLEWIAENFGYFDASEVKDVLNRKVVNTLRVTEGAMLAAYKRDHGRFPAWNEIGGLKRNFSQSKLDSANYFMRSLAYSHTDDDPFTARCTFRELAANSIWERYESFLHGVRMLILGMGFTWDEACRHAHDGFGDLPQMCTNGYLAKLPRL